MKKEIVINASKDRSRIAIVEDGELVELYVEHPDNVRTLGNIYLARIRKIMPGIRAAFVDIGQKQDAFLHFSDLTDNLPALLTLTGEKIPGIEAMPLAHAPQKRIADDESEPAVEDALDFEAIDADAEETDEAPTSSSNSRRSRGGRSGRRNRGGRRRGGRRREEEEEQEEAGEGRRSSPFVIDLTLKTGKVDTASKPERRSSRRSDEEASEHGDDNGDASPKAKRSSRTSRKASSTQPTDDGAETSEAKETSEPQPARRSSRSRTTKTAKPVDAPEASDTDGESPAEAEASETVDSNTKPRRASRTRQPRQRSTPAEPEAAEPTAAPADAEADDAQDDGDDTSSDGASGGRRRRRGRRGGRRRRRGGNRSTDATTDDAKGDDDASTDDASEDAGDTPQAGSSRGRSGRGRRSAKSGTETGDASETTSEADASRSPRGRAQDASSKGGRSSGRGRAKAEDASGADASGGAETRSRSREERSSSRSGRGAGDRSTGRSSSDASSTENSRDTARSSEKKSTGWKAPSVDRPEEYLRRDGSIPVKITKEPISSKGSRVSTDISLAGRFLVLVPAADYVAVSKKIESAKERRRLKSLASSLKPEGCGVIVRTVAEGRDAKTLDTDLRLLIDKWRKIESQIRSNKNPPALLYEDVNMVSSIIRDLFTEDYDRILIDDPKLHKNVQAYIQAVAPHMAEKVVLHRSNTPVFRAVGLEKAVEQVFSSRVPLPSGGYLFIEHTEAMHVVDVNSGRAGRGKSQSENILAVNLEAAREVAKQLRLRDLGGIIVVDCIDMRSETDRRKVYNAFKTEFKKDRAVTKLLPMSDFGLIEITRQRLRPSITTQGTAAQEGAEHLDPQAAMEAAGAAEIPQPDREFGPATLTEPVTTEDVVDQLAAWFAHYRAKVSEKHRDRPLLLQVHPLLASHLRRGFPSLLTKLRFRNRPLRFRLDTDATLHPLAFEVRDEKSGKPLKTQYTPSA